MKIVILALSALVSSNTWAAYNANISGVIEHLMLYSDAGYIYFQMENQPTTHPTCNPSYFVINASIPVERRQMMLSRLLLAYASKEVVNIGYDDQGDCSHGYIRVHRAG